MICKFFLEYLRRIDDVDNRRRRNQRVNVQQIGVNTTTSQSDNTHDDGNQNYRSITEIIAETITEEITTGLIGRITATATGIELVDTIIIEADIITIFEITIDKWIPKALTVKIGTEQRTTRSEERPQGRKP